MSGIAFIRSPPHPGSLLLHLREGLRLLLHLCEGLPGLGCGCAGGAGWLPRWGWRWDDAARGPHHGGYVGLWQPLCCVTASSLGLGVAALADAPLLRAPTATALGRRINSQFPCTLLLFVLQSEK